MWRYAHVSVRGTSHAKTDKPCQDFSLCTTLAGPGGAPVLLAAVSDGAGSAERSDKGSELACTLFAEEVGRHLEKGGDVSGLTREFGEAWLGRFQRAIRKKAAESGCRSREYACTFLAAVVGEDSAVFMQIGDGAIVLSGEEGVYMWEFWPQQGEYENTTYFATQSGARKYLQHSLRSGAACGEVALFTDGLQRLALHYQTRTAYEPFFRPFFSALRRQEKPQDERYGASLRSFLDSPRVNERTDDDKTLVLATRLAGAEGAS
ncbi:PP2C family serine/threonine-protein phosphatase [Saccharibacillus sp. CPCC 101409]|uniref:PP2C family serine/threonine-protein phosphatase n=1 Tax=Saccharibacillus sp. CPCC 101409 TaxID=3058041 RepID=UPI0026741461|nr:PP2C family serine/threonine-protein phosphatase [Saccharibacillus sp. CPCC 101409]MDO3408182.1 PP2C family serine/threonine-protein phosphatase [Saccharibacillus sp. CPCC 101409]